MKVLNMDRWMVGIGTALLVLLTWIPSARAEIVYEDETQAVDARAAQRKQVETAPAVVIPASNAVVSSQEAPVMPTPPSSATTAEAAPTQTELMRRERTRLELKNEDVLQTRLEELRLRDEKRRTQDILGSNGLVDAPAGAAAPVAATQAPVVEQVKAPVTQTPGVQDQIAVSQAAPAPVATAAVVAEEKKDEEKSSLRVGVAPWGGISNMLNPEGWDIGPRFSVGGALTADVTDHLAVTLGYTYSEYGVRLANYNYAASYYMYPYTTNAANYDTLIFKQNVIDAGLKLNLLGKKSAVRPFIGGGGAYSIGFLNFNQRSIQYQNAWYGWYGSNQQANANYEIQQFLGYLRGGTDLRLSENVTLGAEFRYYVVLSARETAGSLNPWGFYSGPYPSNYNEITKYAVGGSLARSNFYSILGNVTFSF